MYLFFFSVFYIFWWLFVYDYINVFMYFRLQRYKIILIYSHSMFD